MWINKSAKSLVYLPFLRRWWWAAVNTNILTGIFGGVSNGALLSRIPNGCPYTIVKCHYSRAAMDALPVCLKRVLLCVCNIMAAGMGLFFINFLCCNSPKCTSLYIISRIDISDFSSSHVLHVAIICSQIWFSQMLEIVVSKANEQTLKLTVV